MNDIRCSPRSRRDDGGAFRGAKVIVPMRRKSLETARFRLLAPRFPERHMLRRYEPVA